METVERDYSPKGVKFYYIYKALAHPETNGYVTPFTQEERLMHVREAERTIGSRFTWLCDTIDNRVKHALGDAPNSEFIIDPEGRVAVRRVWCRPEETRKDLARLVGPVDDPTTADEVDLRFTPPPPGAPKGLVPRVTPPSSLVPLRIEPRQGEDGEPFYAKLRAEVEPKVLRGEPGALYLGFHMDPLYHVHWNNLAAPLSFRIVGADGVQLDTKGETAPQVEHPADMDPREFLIDVGRWKPGAELQLEVDYFACSDEEGWCKPIRQSYVLRAERDADGGNARRGGRGGAGRRRPGGPPGLRREMTRNARPRTAGGLAENRLMAKVVSFDAETRELVVRDRTGQQHALQLDEAATLRSGRERAPAAPSALRSGAIVLLRLAPEDPDDVDPDDEAAEKRIVTGVMIR